MTFYQNQHGEAGRYLDTLAANYGRYLAGIRGNPDGSRNVARMVRAAIHRVDIGNTDCPDAWRRLRRESDRILTLWEATARPSDSEVADLYCSSHAAIDAGGE